MALDPQKRLAYMTVAAMAANAETIPPPLIQAVGRAVQSSMMGKLDTAQSMAAVAAVQGLSQFIGTQGWMRYPQGLLPTQAAPPAPYGVSDSEWEKLGQLIVQAAAHATFFSPSQLAMMGQSVSHAFAGYWTPTELAGVTSELEKWIDIAADFWKRPEIETWGSYATAGVVGTGGSGACPFPYTNGLPCEWGSSQRMNTSDPCFDADYVRHGFSTTPAAHYHQDCQVTSDWAVEVTVIQNLPHGSGLPVERCIQVLPAQSREEAISIAQSLAPKKGCRYYLLYQGQHVPWDAQIPAQGGIGEPGGVGTGALPGVEVEGCVISAPSLAHAEHVRDELRIHGYSDARVTSPGHSTGACCVSCGEGGPCETECAHCDDESGCSGACAA